jgi:hypothetical protein
MKKTLTILTISVVLLTGCSTGDRDQILGHIDTTKQVLETTDEEIQELEVLLAQSQDEPIVQRIQGGIEVLKAKRYRLQERLTILENALADAELADEETFGNALIIGGSTATAIGGVMPPPWGTLILGAGSILGAIGTGMNRRKAKQAEATTENIVTAIEVAKVPTPAAPEGVVDFNDEATKAKIKKVMNPTTRAAIDKIRGKS